MIWGIVSADQAVPPATGNACTQGIEDSLVAYIENTPDVGEFLLHLDTSGLAIVPTTPLSSLIEPNGGGYAPEALAVLGGPFTDQFGEIYIVFDTVLFEPTSSLSDITGWFVTADLVGGVAATATTTDASGAVTGTTITLGGGPYQIPPPVTFQPPTSGVTAQGYAVLTGTSVSSIVVTNVGSGYTAAPTVTIGPPTSLQGGGSFATPIPWALGAGFPFTASCYGGSFLPPG